MDYTVLTNVTEEPVSLDDFKTYLRTILGDTSEDDAVIIPVIAAAREYCEGITGRAIAQQEVQLVLDKLEHFIPLPKPPIVDVVSVVYKDVDAVEHQITDFVVDTIKGIVYIPNLPSEKLYPFSPVTITYNAGYTDVPKMLRQAVMLVGAHWYENREMLQFGSRYNEVQAGLVPQILNQYKVWWF